MIYGYVRPLYDDPNSTKQLNLLQEKCQIIFKEEHGEPKKRNQLENLLMQLKPGDVIIVQKMIVLADTFHHFMDLLKLCEKDEVNIHFLQENIQSDELLHLKLKDMMVHILQFQTDLIKQSTNIGIEKARQKGKRIGRPKKTNDNIKKAISMYEEGYTLFEIKNETGISKSTLYRYLEELDKD